MAMNKSGKRGREKGRSFEKIFPISVWAEEEQEDDMMLEVLMPMMVKMWSEMMEMLINRDSKP